MESKFLQMGSDELVFQNDCIKTLFENSAVILGFENIFIILIKSSNIM